MVAAAGSTPSQLADLLGHDAVVGASRIDDYAIGPFLPTAAVKPSRPDEVSTLMEWAHRNEVAVYPAGGRTLVGLGNSPTRPGIALDMTGLDRILDFQPADLTVRVQAGITIRDLDAELTRDGKHVPLAPPVSQRATVGGTLATGISGPLRSTYGLPRDWLIGIGVVAPDGTATKAGGQVVKNVTGYDLNRLYTGSLGTLAVITEATFKIAPMPSDWAVVIASFPDNRAAVPAGQDLLAQVYAPLGLHLLSREAATRLRDADIPGAAGPVAVAIIAGRPSSVQRRVAETAALWADAAETSRIVGGDAIRLTDAVADLPFAPDAPATVCIRINAPPSAVSSLMDMESVNLAGSHPAVCADMGFGGGRLLWWDDFSAADPVNLAGEIRQVQVAASSVGGSAIVETCPDAVKECIDVWGPEPSSMAIMRRVKQQFDPKNILNPGRFIGGL